MITLKDIDSVLESWSRLDDAHKGKAYNDAVESLESLKCKVSAANSAVEHSQQAHNVQ